MGILSGLMLLCVLIVVHEMGHFLFAKWLGVRVLTFSIGFGPKIWGFKRGDTEYRLSAIPLGGYVKMFGESPTEELSPEEQKVSFLHQALWKKSLIAFAGPLFNFILPIFLFFFMFFGNETVLTSTVGTVLPGEPASIAGLKSGDQIKSVDGAPVSYFSDVVEHVSAHPDQAMKFEVLRENQLISMMVTPTGNPSRIGVMPAIQKPIIVVPHPESVAYKAGLRDFDEVISVNGKPILSFEQLHGLLAQSEKLKLIVKRDGKELVIELPAAAKPVEFIVEPKLKRFAVTQDEIDTPEFQAQLVMTNQNLKNASQELNQTRGIAFVDSTLSGVKASSAASELKLERGDRLASVDGKPIATWMQAEREWHARPNAWHIIGVQSKGRSQTMAFRLKGSPPVFGEEILEGIYGEGLTEHRFVGLSQAISRAFEQTYTIIAMTIQSMWMLVSFQVPASELGGPIMIMNVAGEAASKGLDYYLYIMAMISVNLGLLNLLPIPVLDGGHLFLFGIEAVLRRPLSLRARQVAMQIGMFFLLFMMSVAIFNDLSRIFGQT